MKPVYFVATFLVSICAIACQLSVANQGEHTKENKPISALPVPPVDTTPKVTGVGGIFFRTKDTKVTKAWYNTMLGLETNEYGSTFEFRNANRPEEINYLQWSPFNEKTKYFDPSTKEFMINYRVQNLDGLLRKFKANGVTVLDSVEVVEYGKFVHIMDPFGNKIELWEPIDSILTKLGGTTTK